MPGSLSQIHVPKTIIINTDARVGTKIQRQNLDLVINLMIRIIYITFLKIIIKIKNKTKFKFLEIIHEQSPLPVE